MQHASAHLGDVYVYICIEKYERPFFVKKIKKKDFMCFGVLAKYIIFLQVKCATRHEIYHTKQI